MGEIFKENKDSIARWVNIALILLFYYFGVIKTNEKTRVEVEQLQKQYTALELKVENRFNRLDDLKADKEMLNLIIVSIDRIENKIDKLNANK
ncbi:MAG: hypothetical protein GX317_01660 [Staphylococcus equorum]|nr:hypothetical protein [Staphylococcus equorum]